MLMTRIVDFLTFLTLFFVLTLAYRPKKNWMHTLIWMVACCVLGHIGILVEEFIDQHTLALYILNYILIGCLFSLTAVKGQFAEKAMTVSVYCCSFFHITDITRYLNVLLIGTLDNQYWRPLTIPFFLLIGLFLWRFAIHTERKMSKFYLWGIFGAAFLSMASGYIYRSVALDALVPKALCALFQLMLLYIVYWAFSVFIRFYEKNVNDVAVAARTQAEENLVRETVRLNGELCAQRHEINHHLNLLDTLVTTGEYDQAQRLLNKLTHKTTPRCDSVYSGNIIADAILNQFLARAKEQSIICNVDACLDQEIPIQDVDLSSLLSNLLSNALEASAQVADPQVDIHIYPTLRYLCFNVRNRADVEQLKHNPDFQTTKSDPTAHGFGLNMIRQIAEKYDGRASFQVDDEGFFSSKVMLLMTKTDAPSQ